MRAVTLIDTTLRDGAQAPDILFTAEDRIVIVDALYQTGITEIEVGIPAMGEEERNIIRHIVRKYPQCNFSCWCRAKESDISHAFETGCDSVHVSFPMSDAHLGILKKDERWLFDTLSRVLSYSKERFVRVSVGCQDATRAHLDRIIKFVKTATDEGAFRVRLADTVGIFTPVQTAGLISSVLSKVSDANLEFHAHNDLGMATANAMTALQSGASAVSLTVNGIGERAGNAALEEIAIAISRSCPELKHGLRTNRLYELCKLVSLLTSRPIPPDKPVSGAKIFAHESGIHCHALAQDSSSYEPYDPSVVGRAPSEMVAGSHSGSAGIIAMLKNIGINADSSHTLSLIPAIRYEARKLGRSLNTGELKQLYFDVLQLRESGPGISF